MGDAAVDATVRVVAAAFGTLRLDGLRTAEPYAFEVLLQGSRPDAAHTGLPSLVRSDSSAVWAKVRCASQSCRSASRYVTRAA